MIRKIVLAVVLSATVLNLAACNKTPPNVTPSPVALSAVKATEVVHALDVARDVARTLSQEQPPVISAAAFQKVLAFHESVVSVIGATPNGWKATAQAALIQLQKDLPAADSVRLAPYISLVQTLVDAFVPASEPDPALAPIVAASVAMDEALR